MDDIIYPKNEQVNHNHTYMEFEVLVLAMCEK